MAGIYIHIPFCRKACHYCNFHFSTNTRTTDEFVTALLQEISLQKNYLPGQVVETVYFGGGTPSLLTLPQLETILQALQQHFNIAEGVEITLEANPDDITPDKAAGWQQAGVNRLSIGIQSFFETHLQWMNRAHTAQQAVDAIGIVKVAGIHNLTIDLIYGTPGLSDEQWEQNIETAAQQGIQHLSCYALTVEPGTALEKMIDGRKKEAVDTELAARHFEILMRKAATMGFEHYEISNFAKPGFRSRHNSAYWQGAHYLGLGPSAHSFNGTSRQWNVANNALYTAALQKTELPFEIEVLTPAQQQNEYLMTALRTREGIHLPTLAQRFGAPAAQRVQQAGATYVQGDKAVLENDSFRLTDAGKLFADGIAAALFV
jgi:oxygen-independent coproporphyrinogen III oxidase